MEKDHPNGSAQRTIEAEIRAELGRQHRTVASLANKIGYSRQRLAPKIKGHSPLTTDELARISAALGVTLSELSARAERAVA